MGHSLRGNRRDGLPNLERTLLWCMRAWVVGLCQPDAQVGRRISQVFAGLGAPAASVHLGGFMRAIRHGALRTVGVDCPCNPLLDPDEQALLDVVAFAQRGQATDATMLLRTMVTPGATWPALNSACRLGESLAHAGQHLACRTDSHQAGLRSLLAGTGQVSTAIH